MPRKERTKTKQEESNMELEIDHIVFGDIQIWIPKNNTHAIDTAKKMLNLYAEYSFAVPCDRTRH